jgi:hypothetical protein
VADGNRRISAPQEFAGHGRALVGSEEAARAAGRRKALMRRPGADRILGGRCGGEPTIVPLGELMSSRNESEIGQLDLMLAGDGKMSDGPTQHQLDEMSETIKILFDATERLRLQQIVNMSTISALVERVVSQAAHHPRQAVFDGIRDRSLAILTDFKSRDSEKRFEADTSNAQPAMEALFDQLARGLNLQAGP